VYIDEQISKYEISLLNDIKLIEKNSPYDMLGVQVIGIFIFFMQLQHCLAPHLILPLGHHLAQDWSDNASPGTTECDFSGTLFRTLAMDPAFSRERNRQRKDEKFSVFFHKKSIFRSRKIGNFFAAKLK
jgi:hypothetical protein